MDRTDAIAWVLSVCLGLLRKSQAKTLSDLVAATLGVGRITLAGIGRELAASRESSAKHAIKRAWRFCANERVEAATVMLAVMTRLWRRRLPVALAPHRASAAIQWFELVYRVAMFTFLEMPVEPGNRPPRRQVLSEADRASPRNWPAVSWPGWKVGQSS